MEQRNNPQQKNKTTPPKKKHLKNQNIAPIFKMEWFWFGLVSLFNGISTLFRLFNAKAILLEGQ